MNVIGTSTVLIQTACTNDNRDTNTAKLFSGKGDKVNKSCWNYKIT